ncbi:MAG: ABC transporter ATP-binding protein, partial [Deltaproteobacteria bacterium]|nr:ABC transporter ATP-binding protein [Deltaproteobacteria bacterium]
VCALDNINFTIEEKEFVSILGPSGCGKSTAMYLISGLETPTTGEVFFHGKKVKGAGRERMVVFQEYALLPWRTTLANVTLGLEGRYPNPKEIASKYLELVGLRGFENSYPHQLSGGMKQRVSLARSLAVNPEVLLMDEPFASVDAQTREALQNELLSIWEVEKKTVLFVTHSIEEAIYLSQRIIIMTPRPGRVKAELQVPESYPRSYEFRTSKSVQELRHNIHELLYSSEMGREIS